MELPWRFVFWLTYPSVIGAAVFGVMWWRIRRRPTKNPLGEDIRVRRLAGEHLRLHIEKSWDRLLYRFFGLLFLPLAIFVGVYHLTWSVLEPFPGLRMMFTLGAPVVYLIFGVWRLCRCADKIMNLKLGWFGERAVADQLEGLKQMGYEIFHDVPCIGGGGPFNLDHVVVGNGVVVVVETKTYRKPKDTKDGHKVTYNGQMLCWSWGTSTRELEQAQRNAEWLHKELKKHLNVDTRVHPALTFPGWYVIGGPPKAPVLVENHTRLANFIVDRFLPQMTEAETDAVVRHLRKQSSDLDYAALG